MKTYLYFQPEYVREFVCDGSKCGENCCERYWNIYIDAGTYAQYERIEPESKAREIMNCLGYDADKQKYFVKDRPCPFLTEKKLCRLQLEYGESFLSKTCVTYPRRTLDFGKFFERSLVTSCPLAAELILFRDEPIKFEFVEVSEYEHSRDGKFDISPVIAGENLFEGMAEIQIAMISILQERTLSIDQRLIVLGFFLDRLDEITCNGFDKDELTKLIDAYESKNFLSEQVPRMLSAVKFDAKNFVALMLLLLENLKGLLINVNAQKFMKTLVKTFDIVPDEKNRVSATKIAVAYESLADTRKKFLASHMTFLENFLINKLFMTGFPWGLQATVAKNFGVFAATYKLFELLVFSATQQNPGDKDNLLTLTSRFVAAADHNQHFGLEMLKHVPDDIFDSFEMLLDAQAILDTKGAVL